MILEGQPDVFVCYLLVFELEYFATRVRFIILSQLAGLLPWGFLRCHWLISIYPEPDIGPGACNRPIVRATRPDVGKKKKKKKNGI